MSPSPPHPQHRGGESAFIKQVTVTCQASSSHHHLGESRLEAKLALEHHRMAITKPMAFTSQGDGKDQQDFAQPV